MKINLLFSIFLICNFNMLFSQSVYSPKEELNMLNKNGKKTGLWIKKYKNGKTKLKSYFKNGKPHGISIKFDTKGDTVSILNYLKNKTEVKIYSKTPNVILYKGSYNKNKKRIGRWFSYYNNGKYRAIENFTNGKKNGVSIYFHKNGKRSDVSTFKNDTLHGKRKKFHSNGKPFKEYFFNNGVEHGKITSYDFNGKLSYEGNYIKGIKNNNWNFYKKGIFWITLNFNDGEILEEQPIDIVFLSKDSILAKYSLIGITDLIDLKNKIDSDIKRVDSLVFKNNYTYSLSKQKNNFLGIKIINKHKIDFLPKEVFVLGNNIKINENYYFDVNNALENYLFSLAEENKISLKLLTMLGYNKNE